VTAQGGRPLINLFRAQPRTLPVDITMMERHPLGSQAFIPLRRGRYLVVVAPPGEFDPARMRAFWTDAWQGVNYAKGVWHHPLLALDQVSDFVVVDRGGEGNNCDELPLAEPWRLAFEISAELIA
jgi:ureidoglycolate lyase